MSDEYFYGEWQSNVYATTFSYFIYPPFNVLHVEIMVWIWASSSDTRLAILFRKLPSLLKNKHCSPYSFTSKGLVMIILLINV